MNVDRVGKTESRRAIAAYAAVMFLSMLWLAVIVAPPILLAHGHGQTAMALYHGLSGICHQIPSRSFHLYGFPLAVCSRCTGIYLGFTLAGLLYPLVPGLQNGVKLPKFWVIVALLPMLIDFSLGYFGILENTFVSRTVTGALAGAAAAFYLLPDVVAIASPANGQFSFKEQSWS